MQYQIHAKRFVIALTLFVLAGATSVGLGQDEYPRELTDFASLRLDKGRDSNQDRVILNIAYPFPPVPRGRVPFDELPKARQVSDEQVRQLLVEFEEELDGVQHVIISSGEITDDCLDSLRQISNLKFLSLSYTKVSNDGLGSFSELFPSLEGLVLTGARSEADIEALAKLDQLERLHLYNAGLLSVESLRLIGEMASLRAISLQNTHPQAGAWTNSLRTKN